MNTNTTPSADLERYFATLAGREPAGGLLEVRYRDARTHARMRQQFHDAADTRRLAIAVLDLAARSDVYVGVAPRRMRNGGRRAVARTWVLWADIDQPDRGPSGLPVEPGVIVNTGTAGHQHLYWPLTVPLAPAELERGNATLAHAVHGDSGAVLGAATILRPPHTLNHKHRPPSPVTLERLDPRRHHAAEILDGLATPKRPLAPAASRRHGERADPLLAIEPARYVEALTGHTVPRERKINCPLHQDRTPSLHVYQQPENGWHCYGCHRGGTIYDLASAMWGLQTRGTEFLELRARLRDQFLHEPTAHAHREAAR
jgi:hypothetical protein